MPYHRFRKTRVTTFLAAAAFSACVHTSPRPATGYWVSSDSSAYTPSAHFRVNSRIANGGLELFIDSGTVSIPGDAIPQSPALMSNLYLTAIVAVLDSNTMSVVTPAQGRRPPERRGWRPLATSDSVRIVDELHYGEHRALAPTRVTVHNFPEARDVPLWVIFRISGNTVALMAPMAPGAQPTRKDYPGGVQVYACSDRDLFGRYDEARGASLKRAYGLTC